jgi:hypothetical protein
MRAIVGVCASTVNEAPSDAIAAVHAHQNIARLLLAPALAAIIATGKRRTT